MRVRYLIEGVHSRSRRLGKEDIYSFGRTVVALLSNMVMNTTDFHYFQIKT